MKKDLLRRLLDFFAPMRERRADLEARIDVRRGHPRGRRAIARACSASRCWRPPARRPASAARSERGPGPGETSQSSALEISCRRSATRARRRRSGRRAPWRACAGSARPGRRVHPRSAPGIRRRRVAVVVGDVPVGEGHRRRSAARRASRPGRRCRRGGRRSRRGPAPAPCSRACRRSRSTLGAPPPPSSPGRSP